MASLATRAQKTPRPSTLLQHVSHICDEFTELIYNTLFFQLEPKERMLHD